MKRNILNALMTVLAIFLAASCNEAVMDEMTHETGFLSVSVGRDDEVFTKEIVEPSADMAFRIEVYRGETLVAQTADHRTWTESAPLELTVGKYVVKAYYGDNNAGFDAPYYKGETEVTVTTGKIASADITCTLANVMVTVEMDASIRNNFTSYSVYVTDGTDAGVTFSSMNNTLGATGYIPATGTLRWELVLENLGGGYYSTSQTYTDVKPQQHYNLKFALSGNENEAGYAAIKLVVDDSLDEQIYDLVLDFSESELPSYSSNDGFELTNQMSVIVGDQTKKKVTFTVEEGIRSLLLSVDSEVMTRSSMEVYELVEADQKTIEFLASKGIRTESIPYGATSAKVDITDYVKSLPTGNYNVDMAVYDSKGHVLSLPMDFAVISDVDADMVSVTPWAGFAIAKGKYFSASAPEGTTFMYKKAADAAWTTLPSSSLTFDSASKTFEAEIGGLSGNTGYIIKAVSAADTETREVEFKTGPAEVLYNMNFDEWYQDGKVWYPFAQGASPNVWDSANKATSSFGGSSTTPEESHVVSGKAVRMESKYVVIAFAAGNLYTGNFGSLNGLGAILDWGAAFSSRPVALKGWYDYSPAEINRAKDPYSGKKGEMDKCQLMVLLTDWPDQFEINTTEGTFVDFQNDPNIIAFAKYESDVKTNGYKEFVLPIEYRNSRTPKYVVVVACSSYLGDYFTGGEGSTLYVDEFSFEYDITKLTPEQKAKVNYR